MTAPVTWHGLPIDPDQLLAYGCVENVTVDGVTLPRYLAYLYAGLLDQAAQIAAGNATLAATIATSTAGFAGTSASLVAVGTGAKSFTAQASKSWQPGMPVVAVRTTDPATFMAGLVTGYNPTTGVLGLNVLDSRGSGTFGDWTLALGGRTGLPGNAGWAPVLSAVADGQRIVLQVTDWTGGQGSKPQVGVYLGATGLVSDLAQAVDFRGPPGPPGATGSGSTISLLQDGAAVGTPAALRFRNSIVAGTPSGGISEIGLFGDVPNPGANAVYGTDVSGMRGWVPLVQATLTAPGLVELATAAETLAGTDTARAVTPAGLLSVLAGFHPRVLRAASGQILPADANKIFDVAGSGTTTQSLLAVNNYPAGWSCIVRNTNFNDVQLVPDNSNPDTIDGRSGALMMYAGESRLLVSTGTEFISYVLSPYYKRFFTSGMFYPPPGYRVLRGLLWGGGGGGGYSGSASYRGTGGGGGACVPFRFLAAASGTEAFSVSIGAGGAGATTAGGAGGAGGTTTITGTEFGTVVSAFGGAGGSGYSSGASSGGGGGGAFSSGSAGNGASNASGGRPLRTAGSGGDAEGGGGGFGMIGASGGHSMFGGGGGGGNSGTPGFAGGSSIYGGGGGGAGTEGGKSIFGGWGGSQAASMTAGANAGIAPGGGGTGSAQGGAAGNGAAGGAYFWGEV